MKPRISWNRLRIEAPHDSFCDESASFVVTDAGWLQKPNRLSRIPLRDKVTSCFQVFIQEPAGLVHGVQWSMSAVRHHSAPG
jgi:hypothetical protein